MARVYVRARVLILTGQPGAYFITLVTYRRANLFGEIVDGVMQLSPMGWIADEHWRKIPHHFPQVELGTYIIMANHIHGIIILGERRRWVEGEMD